jgi:Xaa-Pro aminopeptidase
VIPVAPDRIERARKLAAEADLDVLLISPGANLRYLTGYDAPPLERLTCLVIAADGEPLLVVPELERPAAEASPASGLGIELIAWRETDDPYALVASRLPSRPRRVALDDRMWAEQVIRFREVLPGAEQALAGTVLRELRMRKSPAEIDALRLAAGAIDRVHAAMGDWLRAGRTECQVGRDIADAIVAEGHVRADFIIVGSGPNGASPHHALSDREIRPGDPVVVDIGGTTEHGYCSDETRMYALGEPPAEFLRYYDVLCSAQDLACAAVRPGVACEQIDRVAREVIGEAGYGEFFVHRTGHGIGLETHEHPYIVSGNSTPLEPGIAFSIEPGIYLPGRHGARIEDILVCTVDGGERLNQRPRELAVLD